MTEQEFEQRLGELTRSYAGRSNNEGCVACVDCERCTDSTFCRRSKHLIRCHYCVSTESAVDCTHCTDSRDLIGCTHCKRCQRCSQSAYLERSVDCTGCSYCFGCVGLSGREFHILNEPYDRSTYFALTARLAKELGASQPAPKP